MTSKRDEAMAMPTMNKATLQNIAHQACDASNITSFRTLATMKLVENYVRKNRKADALRLIAAYEKRFGTLQASSSVLDSLRTEQTK